MPIIKVSDDDSKNCDNEDQSCQETSCKRTRSNSTSETNLHEHKSHSTIPIHLSVFVYSITQLCYSQFKRWLHTCNTALKKNGLFHYITSWTLENIPQEMWTCFCAPEHKHMMLYSCHTDAHMLFTSSNIESMSYATPHIHMVLGVHPYWIGDLDTIIMKTPELFPCPAHATAGFYGNRKSLSQQLEFPHSIPQVRKGEPVTESGLFWSH